MKIENYTMKLYDKVIELWRKAGISVSSSDTKEELEKMHQRNPQLFLLGVLKEKIMGVVMGGYDGRRRYIHHLAIDPKYQEKGYGHLFCENFNFNLKNGYVEGKEKKLNLRDIRYDFFQ